MLGLWLTLGVLSSGTDLTPSHCVDDPQGLLAQMSKNCSMVAAATQNNCEADLGVMNAALTGKKMKQMCPAKCDACPTPAPSAPAAPATTPPTPCVDDPAGILAAISKNCMMVGFATGNDCEADLGTINPDLSGRKMKHLCPAKCDACPTPAPSAPAAPATTPPTPCVDDPAGILAAISKNCMMVGFATGNDCEADLGTINPDLSGRKMKHLCPAKCDACPTPAPSAPAAPATTPPTPCVDDPAGILAAISKNCMMVGFATGNDCEADLGTINPDLSGRKMKHLCPKQCGECVVTPTPAPTPVKCEDDPNGVLSAISKNCMMVGLATGNNCEADLGTINPDLSGNKMKDLCPKKCEECTTAADDASCVDDPMGTLAGIGQNCVNLGLATGNDCEADLGSVNQQLAGLKLKAMCPKHCNECTTFENGVGFVRTTANSCARGMFEQTPTASSGTWTYYSGGERQHGCCKPCTNNQWMWTGKTGTPQPSLRTSACDSAATEFATNCASTSTTDQNCLVVIMDQMTCDGSCGYQFVGEVQCQSDPTNRCYIVKWP